MRRLAQEPFEWRPIVLLVRLRRYCCTGCGHIWRQDMSRASQARARISCRGLRRAVQAVVCEHLSIARVAETLAVFWNCSKDAVLGKGRRILIDDPARFDGVTTIG